MKKHKVNQLFSALKKARPPTPSPGFAEDVMRQVRQEESRTSLARPRIFMEELSPLLPRVAMCSFALVLLGFLSEQLLFGSASLSADFLAFSQEWIVGL
jgi:hypothetical protein